MQPGIYRYPAFSFILAAIDTSNGIADRLIAAISLAGIRPLFVGHVHLIGGDLPGWRCSIASGHADPFIPMRIMSSIPFTVRVYRSAVVPVPSGRLMTSR